MIGKKVEIVREGGGFYNKWEAVVLSVSTTAERFNGNYIQVPCLVVAYEGCVRLFPLKEEGYHTNVKVIDEQDNHV